jgi:hypothetical protein
MSVNGALVEDKMLDSRINVHILASTSVTFTLTTVKVSNLELTHKKRITVQDGLQLCLRIDEGSGVVTEWPDGVNQCGGSLDTIQWNLESGHVARLAAKVELIWQNQAWPAST